MELPLTEQSAVFCTQNPYVLFEKKKKHINGRSIPALNPTLPDSQVHVREYVLFDISSVWLKGKVFRLLVLWEHKWTSSEESPGSLDDSTCKVRGKDGKRDKAL